MKPCRSYFSGADLPGSETSVCSSIDSRTQVRHRLAAQHRANPLSTINDMPSGRLWRFGILVTVALSACSVAALPTSTPAPLPASATPTTMPAESLASSIATTEQMAFPPEPLPTRERRLPTATATPRPATPTPTRAPTVVPTPWRPVTHTFSAPFVLAQSYDGRCADSCFMQYFWWGPEFVLYNDGLLVSRKLTTNGRLPWSFSAQHLSDTLICDTLYELEHTGIFTFDPARYIEIEKGRRDLAVPVTLKIDAWLTSTLTFEPYYFARNQAAYPNERILPDAWIRARRVMTEAAGAATKDYQPDRIAVLAGDVTECDTSFSSDACTAYWFFKEALTPARAWPISSLSLARSSKLGLVAIDGTAAKQLSSLVVNVVDDMNVFTEKDRTYLIRTRPMLPHESLADTLLYRPDGAALSKDTRAKPARTITCAP